MNPADARATLRRALDRAGTRVTLRRGATDYPDLRARVTGFSPDELVGDIDQGSRKIVLEADGLAIVPQKGDFIIANEGRLAVQTVDGEARRLGDVVIAFEIVAKG